MTKVNKSSMKILKFQNSSYKFFNAENISEVIVVNSKQLLKMLIMRFDKAR